MVGQLASAGFSALGSIEAGNAERNVDMTNAANARTAANEALAASTANAAQIQNRTSRIVGQAQATAGASGVSGVSPLSVMHDIASQGELARQMTMWKGRNQSRALLGQAAIYTGEGEQAQQAGEIQAGSTLLTGASSAATTMFPGTMATINNPMNW